MIVFLYISIYCINSKNIVKFVFKNIEITDILFFSIKKNMKFY